MEPKISPLVHTKDIFESLQPAFPYHHPYMDYDHGCTKVAFPISQTQTKQPYNC